MWAGALPGAPFHVDLSVFIPLNFISSRWLGQLLSLPLDSAAPLQGGPTDPGVHPPLCRVHVCPLSLTRASDSSCSCRYGFCEVSSFGLQLQGTPFPKCL